MELVDANIILRYILWDNKELAEKSKEIIENKQIEIPFEVIAEVVYVLEGVYKVKRTEIRDSIIGLFKYPNILIRDLEVLKKAFQIFSKSKFDFVDSILLGYNKVKDAKVYTFDKKLEKKME